MSKLPLPDLPEGDPQRELSEPARRRIYRARLEAEHAVAHDLAKAEQRGENLRAAEHRANVKKARVILKAKACEFIAIRKKPLELQLILDDEVSTICRSLELSAIEKNMLRLELLLLEHPPENLDSPPHVKNDDAWAPRAKRGRRKGIPVNGDKVRQIRGTYSQDDFAGKVGISPSSIQRAEQGGRLDEETLKKIAQFATKYLEQPTEVRDLTRSVSVERSE